MGLLDGELGQIYRRQQQNRILSGLAQGLLRAGAGGAGTFPGIAAGVHGAAQGSGGGFGDIAALYGLQRQIEADKERKAYGTRYSQAVGGPDPQTGIDWRSGRPEDSLTKGMTPQQLGLLRNLPPEQGMGLLAKRAFEKPAEQYDVVQDPYGLGGVGQQSSTTGEIKGYQAKPPQYSGETYLDENLGKRYQINPKTRKREYTSPLTGMEITTPGGTTIRTGVPTGGLQKRTVGNIEDKLLDAREGLARVKSIKAKFKPEYQEVGTRLGHAVTGVKARFGGRVSLEDRRTYTEFADYQRDAISNINLYIKEITGAQMGEAEATRLRLAVPDTGEGIFGGDDPIKFAAKLDSVERDLEKAAVRYEYYLAKGITDAEKISQLSPLEGMPTAVNPKTGERIVQIDGQWIPLQ